MRVEVRMASGMWRQRGAVLMVMCGASLVANGVLLWPRAATLLLFMQQNATAGWQALGAACAQYWEAAVLLVRSRLLPVALRLLSSCLVLARPYLFIVLNLILVKIILRSGVLAHNAPPASTPSAAAVASSPRDVKAAHSVGRGGLPDVVLDVPKKHQPLSDVFSPSVVRPSDLWEAAAVARTQKPNRKATRAAAGPSLFSIEPLHDHPSEHSLYQEAFPLGQSANEGHAISGGPETELSSEEFQEKVDSFISKFRKNLSMQRKDSFARLLSLVSGRDRNQ